MSFRQRFSKSEDEKLLSLVKKYGTDDWDLISWSMGKKTVRQCRDRYCNYVNPDINLGSWTIEEEELLMKKYKELGPKWSLMKNYFNKRTEVNIKNHLVVMVKKQKISNDLSGKSEPEGNKEVTTSEESELERNFFDLLDLRKFDLLITPNGFLFDFNPPIST